MARDGTTQAAKVGTTRRGGRSLVHRDAVDPGSEHVTERATGGAVRAPWIDTSLFTNPWWQHDGIDRGPHGGGHVSVHYDPVDDSYEPLVWSEPGRPIIPRDPPDTWSAPFTVEEPNGGNGAAAAPADDDQPEDA